jgi:conjugative transfer signal peptidase TraF
MIRLAVARDRLEAPANRKVLILAAAALAALLIHGAARTVLINTTPSEPLGLYARTDAAPRPGRLAAFPVPAAAFPYADRRLGYLHHVPLLKMIAAGPGDRVCTLSGQVTINGQARAAIVASDRDGRVLPHWRACRALGPDEFFALSDRVPNSFDSRYFGPVPVRSVIGVFQPLLLVEDGR